MLCMQAALQWLLGTMWQRGKSMTCLCLALQREHMQFKKTLTITSRHCASRAGLLDNPAQWRCAAMMRDIHVMGPDHRSSFTTCAHRAHSMPVPRVSTVRKTRPERDSAGALRRARRNADRRTSGATHASRVCFAQLPHCPERQPAKSGLGTVLPRVVLIAGRPTLQTPRRSPGVYRNLEPSIARASFQVSCPRQSALVGVSFALHRRHRKLPLLPGWL
jgi:hypothetical protein